MLDYPFKDLTVGEAFSVPLNEYDNRFKVEQRFANICYRRGKALNKKFSYKMTPTHVEVRLVEDYNKPKPTANASKYAISTGNVPTTHNIPSVGELVIETGIPLPAIKTHKTPSVKRNKVQSVQTGSFNFDDIKIEHGVPTPSRNRTDTDKVLAIINKMVIGDSFVVSDYKFARQFYLVAYRNAMKIKIKMADNGFRVWKV